MKNDWDLTPEEFDRLLAWLNPDREIAGGEFLKIRERLTRIIASRGCHEAEDVVFEATWRIARKSPAFFASYEGDPIRFFYGVAHNVHHEWLAKQPAWATLPSEIATHHVKNNNKHLEYLGPCLQKLEPKEQEMFVRYYCGEEAARIKERKALSVELNLSENALRIRVSRLRQTLLDCLQKCLNRK